MVSSDIAELLSTFRQYPHYALSLGRLLLWAREHEYSPMNRFAGTPTSHSASASEILTDRVRQIAERETLGDSLQSSGRRMFLNGDKISISRWVELVRELHEAAEKPNLVVVLSDCAKWAQMNAVRRRVVESGGILERTETGEFRSSVEKWIARLSQVPEPAIAEPPPVARASWDLYQGSFASHDEFEALVSELSNHSESGKSSIS